MTTSAKGHSERTCIGCRTAFPKEQVVRIVSGPAGIVIDLRDRLNGRAAYVCPRRDCITKAFSRDTLAKSLRSKLVLPQTEVFVAQLADLIRLRMQSFVSMALKAGKIAAGYSAVRDALGKNRVKLLLFAADVSSGTRDKIDSVCSGTMTRNVPFTRDDFGRMLGRELVGVVAILDQGMANALGYEAERLNGLINIAQ